MRLAINCFLKFIVLKETFLKKLEGSLGEVLLLNRAEYFVGISIANDCMTNHINGKIILAHPSHSPFENLLSCCICQHVASLLFGKLWMQISTWNISYASPLHGNIVFCSLQADLFSSPNPKHWHTYAFFLISQIPSSLLVSYFLSKYMVVKSFLFS